MNSTLSIFATEKFAVMGEEGFGSLNSVFPASKSPKEVGTKNYLTFVRTGQGISIAISARVGE